MIRAAALGAVVVTLVLAACAGDDSTDDTLAPLGSGGGAVTTPSPSGSADPSATPSSISGPVGAGVVRLSVRLAGPGIDEDLSLDRATVAAAALDPVNVDASCTAIDGGDGLTVSVVDLRRLFAGQRLLSATLRIDDEVAAAGEYTGTLEVGDADQQTTRFEGPVRVDEGLASGTFDLLDGDGAPATGSFACAADVASLPTTTTVPPLVADTLDSAAVSIPEVTVPSSAIIITPTTPLPAIPDATS